MSSTRSEARHDKHRDCTTSHRNGARPPADRRLDARRRRLRRRQGREPRRARPRPAFRSRPAFVVGAPVYAAFVDATGLRDTHRGATRRPRRRRLRGARGGRRRGARARRRRARARRHRRGDPSRPTRSSSATTHDAPVAVRSSATAEDTEAASFAGMNETFLNMRGADAVVDAVRRCWSSLFGARTIFYRAKRGFGQADMDIAVVVQRQIDVAARRRHVHDRPVQRRHRPARDRGLVRPRRGGRQRPRLARPLRRRQGDARRSSSARSIRRRP